MRALLVLDKSSTRRTIEDYLNARGFTVRVGRTASEALRRCEHETFDLFVVDSVLTGGPIKSGLELCRDIRRQPQHERAITVLLTISERPQDHRQLVDCGADDYVTLPLDPELLHARLYLAEQRIRLAHELQREGQGGASPSDLREVADASPVMIWVTDDRGRCTFFNRAYVDFTGRSVESQLGLGWADALHPEDYSRCLDSFLAAFEHRVEFRDEYRLASADGAYRWVLSTAVPRFRSDGSFSGYFGTGVDISDQKRSEALLRDSEERLRLVLRNMPVMMVAFDEEGRVIVWNRECERVTGYRAVEILGNPNAMELFAPDEENREELLERWARPDRPYRDWELSVRCRDGIVRSVSWSNISDELQVSGWASWGIGVDVTERKRAEAEHRALEAKIQRAQRFESLSVLAGGVAHDFNNLLVGILGKADLARNEIEPGHPAYELLVQVEEAAQMAAELTNQMLAYSGRGKFILRPIDLSALVDGIHNILETGIPKGVEVIYRLDPEVPFIEGDTTQIQQVALNLFVNAAEAIGDCPGTITVETGEVEVGESFFAKTYLEEPFPEGRYSYLQVTDTGDGMSEETRAKVFDPFFTTKFTGRGLGMAAVLGIVRGHGGAIKIDTAVGKGTTVTVVFPRHPNPPARRSAPARIELTPQFEPTKSNGAILVVDDEETVRSVAKRMLEGSGYRVLVAEDGPRAVEAYQDNHDDLQGVLLDMSMPQMNGVEVLRELHRIDRGVPVILSSGYSEEDVQSRFPGDGPAGFIQKPYTARGLVDKVREVLRAAGGSNGNGHG